MNRVIIEVLPTLWSPKKTSLYLAMGAGAAADAEGEVEDVLALMMVIN